MSARIAELEAQLAGNREAVLREAATICKRLRNDNKHDLSEDALIGVLECAIAISDAANAARSQGGAE